MANRKESWINRKLIMIIIAANILSCKEAKKQEPPTTEVVSQTDSITSVEAYSPTEEIVPLPTPPRVKDTVIMVYSDFNAVVIENTLLRQQPNVHSYSPASLMTGDQVKILEQGEKRFENGDRDQCGQYGYYWYKVLTTDNQEGYLYGKQLLWKSNTSFILNPEDDKEVGWYSLSATNLIADDTTYYFDGAVDLSIGASTSEGTTGCDRWYAPMFVNSETNKISFIYIDNSFLNSYDGHLRANREGVLMMLYESEGGKVEPYEIVNSECDGNPVITIRSSHHYQDGGSESVLCIRRKDGWFDVVDLQRQSWDREPE